MWTQGVWEGIAPPIAFPYMWSYPLPNFPNKLVKEESNFTYKEKLPNGQHHPSLPIEGLKDNLLLSTNQIARIFYPLDRRHVFVLFCLLVYLPAMVGILGLRASDDTSPVEWLPCYSVA
jgi:hypothetical protein